MKNVVEGEQVGISKQIGWKGGGSFVYCELMKLNEIYVEGINKAKTKEDLQKICNLLLKALLHKS